MCYFILLPKAQVSTEGQGIWCRLHLPSSKHTASANASKLTAWKRVHAVITGKNIQSGNYFITPWINIGIQYTLKEMIWVDKTQQKHLKNKYNLELFQSKQPIYSMC
jgi:hypothetical protein